MGKITKQEFKCSKTIFLFLILLVLEVYVTERDDAVECNPSAHQLSCMNLGHHFCHKYTPDCKHISSWFTTSIYGSSCMHILTIEKFESS
jgi:hypothetical protein